jgi:hypothetical protein
MYCRYFFHVFLCRIFVTEYEMSIDFFVNMNLAKSGLFGPLNFAFWWNQQKIEISISNYPTNVDKVIFN